MRLIFIFVASIDSVINFRVRLEVVSAVKHNWLRYFGVMSILVSDQGPQFRGAEFQAFCERWGIKHNFSLAYSPSGNGCCEVLLRIVARRLRAQPEPNN